MPRFSAPGRPRCLTTGTYRTRLSATPRTISAVRSVDSSSTTRSSKSGKVWARTLAMAAPTNRSALCTAMTTLTVGARLMRKWPSSETGVDDETVPPRSFFLELREGQVWHSRRPFAKCALLAKTWIATERIPVVEDDDRTVDEQRFHEFQHHSR